MALNIKNAEVDRLARRAAELRETGITEAVQAALERDLVLLEEEREKQTRDFLAKVRKAQARIAAAPVLDPRPADEIMDELNDDVLDGR
ncbi:MAG: type II toxin-antitoxin system VapB family antitoxin [Brevundimonas sp.]